MYMNIFVILVIYSSIMQLGLDQLEQPVGTCMLRYFSDQPGDNYYWSMIMIIIVSPIYRCHNMLVFNYSSMLQVNILKVKKEIVYKLIPVVFMVVKF